MQHIAPTKAHLTAARVMLAALQRATFYIETVAEQDKENDIDGDAAVDLRAARGALELAKAAGITPDDAQAQPPSTVFATLAQIHRARDEYSSDDIKIDNMNVRTSEADDGTWIAAWIAAWVWLADEDEDDAG